ncbi:MULTISPECIES: hypothetical protein [Sinorhizobium/Ensifer group]|jgi:DNA-directed RNA polymerase specialized sigma24 family protein|uniref:hypothetical protein n=1 Tax=Sinorhizobium/Ensifer group TaxID=227292 RepID=UPI00071E15F9|nr:MULTISPECIES: hypothetical protein [Sinorhizobium/Ensifer group]KSV81813.1 hypothetical protein N183_14975 [Sinorhizobium sp. Sb3]
MPSEGIVWSEIQWDQVLPRVLLFAVRLMRKRPFAGAGTSAEDLVFDAVGKTMSGARQWRPEEVGLTQHLMGVVSSDLYNLVRKSAAFKSESLDEAAVESLVSNEPSPEETTIDRDEISAFLSFLRNRDSALADVASAMILLGVDRPRELAESLDITIENVHSIKKRLRRASEDYLARGERK